MLHAPVPNSNMTHPTQSLHIPDTQSARDERHLAIQRVGIKDVRYPLHLKVAGAVQATTAMWDLDVALPAEKKGTHMSRFVAWLNDLTALDAPLDVSLLRERLAEMLGRLGAVEGRVEARPTARNGLDHIFENEICPGLVRVEPALCPQSAVLKHLTVTV